MSRRPDYIPNKDRDLLSWTSNFFTKVEAGAQTWGIPAAEITALSSAFSKFANFLSEAEGPERTPVVIEKKNMARDTLVGLIREMVRAHLNGANITNDVRLLLGLHLHDTERTPVPVPTDFPDMDIRPYATRRLDIHFHDKEGKKAKPYGVNGAVIIYAVLDEPTTNYDLLGRSALATRTPHSIEFPLDERGRTVYIAICWQNEKGQRGPWSLIQSAIVP
ncbi:MAG: hypothetical protein LBS05_06650 [Tannerellaceae bacterium]|jgi:hypothetical protein|nr:hypothetical protein [Tannerellaceae bacterium]